MALNVTTAVIGSGCNTATATPSLAQWDQGQVLKIEGVDLPSAYQVEFSTEYTRNAIQKIGNANGVAVPNELLQRSAPITAYIVLHEGENDRETEYWITIYITPRTPPETVTPDPEEQSVIDETIAALQDGVAAAEAAAQSVQNMGVEAETLAPGSPLTVTKEVDPETGAVTLIFGLTQGPKGDNGYSPTITITEIPGGHRFTVTDAIHPSGQSFDVLDGAKGDKGDDGYSPTITITTITGGHRFTVTDKTHPSGQSFDVLDGAKGDQGDDGYSPVVTITTITGGHRVTITDKTHPSGQSFDVMDGASDAGQVSYDPTQTYPDGSVGKEVSNQKNAINDIEDALTIGGEYEFTWLDNKWTSDKGNVSGYPNWHTTGLLPVPDADSMTFQTEANLGGYNYFFDESTQLVGNFAINGETVVNIPVTATQFSVSCETAKSCTIYTGTGLFQAEDAMNAISRNEQDIANTQSMIATVEATATASKNYVVDDLLVYDGKLYKVTSAIATGATITVGTNVSQTTVADQIISLMQRLS